MGSGRHVWGNVTAVQTHIVQDFAKLAFRTQKMTLSRKCVTISNNVASLPPLIDIVATENFIFLPF